MESEEPTLVKLAIQSVEDSKRWFPQHAMSIPHHTLRLTADTGSIADIVGRIERGELDFSDAHVRYELTKEISNAFVSILNLAGLTKVDLYKLYMYRRGDNESEYKQNKKEPELKLIVREKGNA